MNHLSQDELLAYALGESLPEAAAHLRSCEQCNAELASHYASLGALGMSEESAAPAHLRGRILGSLSREQTRPSQFARQSSSQSASQSTTPRRWSLIPSWIPTFAAALLLIAVGLLWRDDLAQRRRLHDELAQLQQPEVQADLLRRALAAPDAQQFSLLPASFHPVMQGKAIYRAQQQQVIFIGSHFAAAPAGKAYELWLLPSSGAAPIAAGVFQPDAAGNVSLVVPRLLAATDPKGFAITIEADSGSDKPTSAIILAGLKSQG